MKKWVYAIIVIAILIIAIIVGKELYKKDDKKEENVQKSNNIENRIVNETDYSVKNDITIETNTKNEKISPNASLVLKKHYKKCEHTIKQYAEIPQEFVNLTQEELQKEYQNWEIEEFTSNKVTLIKEEEGECGEHYVLKPKNGVIVVYKKNSDGNETMIEETGIAIDYLTKEDKEKIEKGINVYGKEELNSTLEDYE